MSQKIAFQGMLFLTGLMAGILLESRYFHARRVVAAAPASIAAPTTVPVEVPSEEPTLAKIQVDEPVFKFGTTETGGKIEHTFLIKNVGNDPLIVKQVQAACGCTTTNLAQTQIEPGGSSELKAVLDLKGRVGPQSSSITVKSNDSAQSDLKLTLVGNVISRVTTEPASLDFGRLSMPPLRCRLRFE